MEAATVMLPQGAPEAGRGKEGSSTEPLEGTWPYQHIDFGHMVSRTEKINPHCFKSLGLW